MTTTSRSGARTAERARKEAALREAKRRRAVAWGGGLLVLALLAAIAVAVAIATGGDDEPTGSGAVVVPASATAEGIVPVGRDDAPVTVTVFYDYMCPFCARFEAANSADLKALIDSGQARVELRPMSFLDAQSQGTRYSTRAANALATVADAAPEKVWPFNRALFEQQPGEGTAGLSDERIAEVARDAGVPDAVAEEFGQRTFDGWVAQGTEKAFAAGVKGTPTVHVDGVTFSGDLYTAGPLADAVRAAAGR